jgi:hypothetical protein
MQPLTYFGVFKLMLGCRWLVIAIAKCRANWWWWTTIVSLSSVRVSTEAKSGRALYPTWGSGLAEMGTVEVDLHIRHDIWILDILSRPAVTVPYAQGSFGH